MFIQVILPLRLEWNPVYSWPENEGPLPGEGLRVRVLFSGKEYVGVVLRAWRDEDISKIVRDPSKIKPIIAVEGDLGRISHEELEFWKQLSSYYLCTLGEVSKAALPYFKVHEEELELKRRERIMARLEATRARIEKARKDSTRAEYTALAERLEAMLPSEISFEAAAPATGSGIILNEAQQSAENGIKSAFSAGKPALLRGVTGSGKTEIYMKLAEEVLMAGRSVLYLVPEIALSSQLEDRIRKHFPGVLLFHSNISSARKKEIADRLRTGVPAIVLGTRSSLFLPHRNLGLIIVDEEHDTSYKQDSPAPRYNGRDAAVMLSKIHGAGIILGSATPSLESLYNAENKRYVLVELNERFYKGEDADVEIVDTTLEQRRKGMIGDISRKLAAHIGRVLSERGQVLILRARRSWSPSVQCSECGTIPKCPRCDVSLSVHIPKSGQARLVCHHCGYSAIWTGTCPECGGAQHPVGSGTQKIEEEVTELFPGAVVGRLDSDTPPNEAEKILDSFSKGKTDILVGTQIITKGFDFGRLSLVGAIQADSLLGVQDFRADEKTAQLLEQFHGRTGRRGGKGLLVIQTKIPGHPVFKQLDGRITKDELWSAMLRERREFNYPPFTRMITVIIKDHEAKRLSYMGNELRDALSRLGLPIPPFGPYSPSVSRVGDINISHIRIMLPRDKALTSRKGAIAKAVGDFEKDRKYPGHIAIDVDPVL